MKIDKIAFAPVGLNTQKRTAQNNNNNVQTSPIEQKEVKMFAYQDYNISFGGRTPEDFYAQDFNRNNMPETMKMFLDYDYETRQHIPPEQMMHEVFKYIEKAKDFDEVKKFYPNEELFQNLHPCKVNPRDLNHRFLYQMITSRSASDTPLLKDGSDDFGMYVLKKIYSEGKTLKEISKDFLEKDMSDTYRGYITSDIDYQTVASYGIKFPKRSFWHSFIATREEYKKFFLALPKNMVDPNRMVAEAASKATQPTSTTPEKVEGTAKTEKATAPEKDAESTKSEESSKADKKKDKPKPPPRLYKTSGEKKDRIRKYVKEAEGDNEVLRKKISSKSNDNDNEPADSFVLKYFSPIMILAANKIHLSEELKDFCENEKLYGLASNEEQMLKRFWNSKPELRENYSHAVTDSIEIFEEAYGVGGNIPINSDFEPITKDTKNQHVMDFVSEDFIDLLNYTKGIEPNRNKRYEEHEKLQKEWEEFFAHELGDPVEEVEQPEEPTPVEQPKLSTEELLRKVAAENNCKIYKIRGKNGKNIQILSNFDELYNEKINIECYAFPSKYVSLYKKSMLDKDERIPEGYKLAMLTEKIRDEVDDDRIMSDKAARTFDGTRRLAFSVINEDEDEAAIIAMGDVVNNHANNDDAHNIYQFCSDDYRELNSKDKNNIITRLLINNKDELNSIYAKYTTKPTTTEKLKIGLAVLEDLAKYNPKTYESTLDTDDQAMILIIKDSCKTPERRKLLRDIIEELAETHPFIKCMLRNKSDKKNEYSKVVEMAKFEKTMQFLLKKIAMLTTPDYPLLNYIVSSEALQAHSGEMSSSKLKDVHDVLNRANAKSRSMLSAFEAVEKRKKEKH